MSDKGVGKRPGYITLIVVLVVVSGIVAVITGSVLVLARNSVEVEKAAGQASGTPESAANLLALGLAQIVIGVVYLAVARGLARGLARARTTVMVLSVLSLVGGVWTLLSATSTVRPSAAIGFLIAVETLVLLVSDRAKVFFGVSAPVITIPPSR